MADKRLSTPVGTAVYPRLKTPDTKFDDLGIYKADVSVSAEAAAPLIDILMKIWKDHVGKAAKKADNPMFANEVDEAGEETGNVVFKLRVKNRMNKKGELWDRRPALFDAALKPIDVNPWGGSQYAVSFDTHCWDYGDKKGVSLQPAGVQIIELVTGDGSPNASAMGFAAQEGYAAPEYEGSGDFEKDEEPAGDKNVSGDETPSDGDY